MRPPWLTDIRPSCGLRRSAMSMSDMILSRDDTVLDRLGRRLHLVQNTVDAVPHTEVVLAGLDVDIGRLVLDALADEQVDESNDRRVVLVRLGASARATSFEPLSSSIAR